MRIILLAIMLVISSCHFSSANGDNIKIPLDKNAAMQVAKEVFLNKTKGEITKYAISDSRDEGPKWVFFFEGQEEFKRPGYHWVVKIEKATGQAEFVAGE